MFRRSGPGHMLLHTVQKQKVQGRISLSLVKVKVKFTQTEVYKDPLMEKLSFNLSGIVNCFRQNYAFLEQKAFLLILISIIEKKY